MKKIGQLIKTVAVGSSVIAAILYTTACGESIKPEGTRTDSNPNFQKIAANKTDLVQSLSRVERAAELLLQAANDKSIALNSEQGQTAENSTEDFVLTDDQEVVVKVAKILAKKDAQGAHLCKIQKTLSNSAGYKGLVFSISGDSCGVFVFLERVIPINLGDFLIKGEFEIKDAELVAMLDLKKGTISGSGQQKVEALSAQKAGIRTRSSIRVSFENSGGQIFNLYANGNEFFDQYDSTKSGQRVYRLEFSDSSAEGLVNKYTEIAGLTRYNSKTLKDKSSAKFNGKDFKYESFQKFEEMMGFLGLL